MENIKIETGVKESFNGHHQVYFTIGVQTFSLQEVEADEEMTSKEKAEWYEKNLNTAFDNLNQDNEKQLIDFFMFMEENGLIHERIECSKTIMNFQKQQNK